MVAQCSVHIYENTIFQKISESSTVRSQWLVSFLIDLKPYEKFIEKLALDIEDAYILAEKIIEHYDDPRKAGFLNAFEGLRQEILSLRQTREVIIQTYTDYRSMQTRSKRSLIPIVGKIMSFLFGTVSSSDLKTLKRNIHNLAANQLQMAHVLEDSLSIINITRVDVSQNRQMINNLSVALHQVDNKLINVTQELEEEIIKLGTFIQLYLKLDLIVEELKTTVQKAHWYLEHLKIQLSQLTIGHLSPSILSVSELKHILYEIKTQLPPNVRLPIPISEVWEYYKTLTCALLVQDERFVVVVSLPLLDLTGKFEIYKIFNIPLPYSDDKLDTDSLPDITAAYALETNSLAIDPQRTKFAILSPDEIEKCSLPLTRYCKIRSPIYPVNLSKLCVIALFMKNTANVKKYCSVQVQPNSLLPSSLYFSEGEWVVASRHPIRFAIVCDDGKRYTTKTLAPLDVLPLPMSCSASSDHMTLSPFYHKESQYHVNDPLKPLLSLHNQTDLSLWEPFRLSIPNLTKTEMPKKLKSIQSIPMFDFIETLRSLRTMKHESKWPTWLYILIILGPITVLLAIALFVYVKYGDEISACWFAKNEINDKDIDGPMTYLFAPVGGSGSPGSAKNTKRDVVTPLQTVGMATLPSYQQHQQPGEVQRTLYPSLELASAPDENA